MITFNETMDPHSVDVRRDGRLLAVLQWHSGRPRLVVMDDRASFTLSELEDAISELKRRCGK